MPNFEKPPAPVEPKGEKKADKVVSRLTSHIDRWRRKYALVVVASTAANLTSVITRRVLESKYPRQGAAKSEPTPPEALDAAPDAIEDIPIPEDDIRALDPEASPERLRFILATYPRGFAAGEIRSIDFLDEAMPLPPEYGIKGEVAAHAKGGVQGSGTAIEFFRGSRDATSYELWADTLAHEAGHGGDWVRNGRLTAEQREEFRRRVQDRVFAGDRYRSDYVEAIYNEDQENELETKATEYWAEIFSAYMRGDWLWDEDRLLVEWVIGLTDPDYEHEASLKRRDELFTQMALEESLTRLRGEDPGAAKELESWLEAQAAVGFEEFDALRRRSARAELVQSLRAWADTPEREAYAEKLIEWYARRDDLMHDIDTGRAVGVSWDTKGWARAGRELEALEAAAEDPEDLRAFRSRFGKIAEENGVRFGYRREGTVLEPGEFVEYGFEFENDETPPHYWIIEAVGWRRSEEDYTYKEAVVAEGVLLRWISYAE